MPRIRSLPSLGTVGATIVKAAADADPGLIRLRSASRVTFTLILVAVILAGFHLVTPLPTSAYAVALTLALQGAIVIRDATRSHRLVTRTYSAGVGFAVLAVVSAWGTTPAVVDMMFLAVAFAAVYARKWGMRWNAVGMFAFMSCFMGAYFRPTPGDLPAIAVTLVLSTIIAHLVREFVIPDRPAFDFRRTLQALDGRIGSVVSVLRAGQRSGWTPRRRQAAIAAEQRVKDALLVAEGLLPADGAEAESANAATTLSIKLFEVHLAVETALAVGFAAHPGDEKALDRMMSAFDRLAKVRLALRQTAASLTDEVLDGPRARAGSKSVRGDIRPVWKEPAFQLAFQVTLACAIAMAGGLLVSPQRWFWAVLTAFLVFTNTQSRGDAALRGINRALGTAVGIVVGIGIATLLHGEFAWSLALISACVFVAFYLVQLSYGALTFFMTIALSLLYGLLGNFSPGLLVLRLEETLVGAAAGVLVSFFVFPQRTGKATHRAVDGFLSDLDRLLAAFTDRRRGDASAWRLVAITRALDRRHAEIVSAVRPLSSGWLGSPRRRAIRLGLLRFTVLTYWSHMLAGAADKAAAKGDEIENAVASCRSEIASARRRPDAFFEHAQPVSLTPPGSLGSRDDLARPQASLSIHAIRHVLNQTLGDETRVRDLA